MGKRVIFDCNICREDKDWKEMWGVIFSNMTKFKIGDPKSTDGVHICDMCLNQLREQLMAGVTKDG